MSEKGQPLPYRLGACAGCCDLTEQLARSTHAYQLLAEAHEQQGQQLAQAKQEQDDLRKDRDDAVDMREGSLMRVDGLQQQLVQAQAARTICDVHQAEFDRLEEQLAQAKEQLSAYRERLEIGFVYDLDGNRIERPGEALGNVPDGIYCRDETIRLVEEHVTELRQQLATATQQLAQATQLSDSRRMVMEDQATMLNEYVQQLATVTSALDILCQAIEQGEQDEDYLRRRLLSSFRTVGQS